MSWTLRSGDEVLVVLKDMQTIIGTVEAPMVGSNYTSMEVGLSLSDAIWMPSHAASSRRVRTEDVAMDRKLLTEKLIQHWVCGDVVVPFAGISFIKLVQKGTANEPK